MSVKLSEAIEKGKAKCWVTAQLRKNPDSPDEWFAMMVNREAKQFMLVSDDESPVVNDDLNTFVALLSEIGIKEFTVFL